MINTTQELMDKLAIEGKTEMCDQIYDTEDIILLIKGLIDKIIALNRGELELAYHSFSVKDFEESHVMINDDVKLCTKYKCLFSFTIECCFDNSLDCRMASTQAQFISENLSSSKIYNPYLESLSKYREIISSSYKRAKMPEINISISDNLSIGKLEQGSNVKAKYKSRAVIFCESILEDVYFKRIEKITEKNIDKTVK